MQCFSVEKEFNVLPDKGYTKDQVITVTAGSQEKVYCYKVVLHSNSSAPYDPPVLPAFLKTSQKKNNS